MKWLTSTNNIRSRRGFISLARIFAPLLLVIGLISGLTALTPPRTSYAVSTMPLPSTPNQINFAYAYRNLLVPGDQMYVVDFFTGYTPPLPDFSATQSYVVKAFTSTGTLIGSVAPFAYFDNGYQRNIAMIYFPVATAPTWNNGETVSLSGNPGLTWAGAIPNQSAPVSYWSPSTSISFTQNELSSTVITWAGYLQQAWFPTVTMIQQTVAGQKLSTAGQTFFVGVMPTLQQMAPGAFAGSMQTPTAYNKNVYGDQYAASNTSTVTNSPVTLHSGVTTLTVTAGDFIVVLSTGRTAVVTSGTGTVFGSPLTIRSRSNTVTITVPGNITVNCSGEGYGAQLLFQPIGTALDTTGLASFLNISVIWTDSIIVFAIIFGLDWLIVAGANKIRAARGQEGYSYGYAGGGGTGMMKWMLLVDVMIMDLAAFLGMFSLVVDIGLAIFSMFIVVLIILWNKSSA